MGLVDPACDHFDLGKLDFHLPGGPAQSAVSPTQSAVGAAQSALELTETINMVHRVLFRPPHRVPGVEFFRACGADPETLYYSVAIFYSAPIGMERPLTQANMIFGSS